MITKPFPLIATLVAALLCGGGRADAQNSGPPEALVLSNVGYASLPKLANCDLSANLVAAVLTRAGFHVTRRSALSNARLGTAIADLGEAGVPGSRSVLYFCGYAVSYADRLFVLPTEARLDRDSDVLSQGVVARLLMSSVAGPGSAAGLVLMDVATPPGSGKLDFAAMLRPTDTAHGGLLAAALTPGAPLGPAPVAAAIADAPPGTDLEVGRWLGALAADPALRPALLIARPPAEPSWLLGGAAPTPEAAVADTPASTQVVLPATPAAPPPAPVPPPPVAAPPAAQPDAGAALADPNPADRRRLQLSLNRLGYYHGRIDGVFSTETVLAIRQFQRESNAEPTGRLTNRQVDDLLK